MVLEEIKIQVFKDILVFTKREKNDLLESLCDQVLNFVEKEYPNILILGYNNDAIKAIKADSDYKNETLPSNSGPQHVQESGIIHHFSISLTNGKFFEEYEVLKGLGRGNFGEVFKVINKKTKNISALKTISKTFDEWEIFKKSINLNLSKRHQELHLVEYLDLWFENDLEKMKITLLMTVELCDASLGQIVQQINENFFENNKSVLTPIGYYIASELFTEVLECLQLMHGMKPSLIHCNIKPENILLKKCDSNKILIKFADFFIKPITDSNEVENKYIAPECEYSKEYYKESDIFSLGLICQELFHINVNG